MTSLPPPPPIDSGTPKSQNKEEDAKPVEKSVETLKKEGGRTGKAERRRKDKGSKEKSEGKVLYDKVGGLVATSGYLLLYFTLPDPSLPHSLSLHCRNRQSQLLLLHLWTQPTRVVTLAVTQASVRARVSHCTCQLPQTTFWTTTL